MTTDIRAESVALLAEALHTANGSGCLHEDGYGGTGWVQCDKDASWTIECSPTLARRLAFATAWEMAEAALPEGYIGPMLYRTVPPDRWAAAVVDMRFTAALRAWDVMEYADTPTAALLALAAKLTEATR